MRVAAPWSPSRPGLPAYVVYAKAKTARIGGRWSAPNVDAQILRVGATAVQYYQLGLLEGEALLPSDSLPYSLGFRDVVAALLTIEPSVSDELRFVRAINRGVDRSLIPWKFRWLWDLRTVLIARAIAHRMHRVAEAHPVAYVSDFYSAVMLGVTIAFRRAGRPVWDIQHGRIGPGHQTYNATVFGLRSHGKPTGLLLWDAATGPYAEQQLGVSWESTAWAHLRLADDDEAAERCGVLYTLQVDTPIPPAVGAAIRALPHVPWRLRLHPGGRNPERDYAPLLQLPNVTLSSSAEPLPQALRAAAVHVTWNSSVISEAAALGTPSVFMDPAAQQDFASEVTAGLASCIEPDRLTAALRDALASTPRLG